MQYGKERGGQATAAVRAGATKNSNTVKSSGRGAALTKANAFDKLMELPAKGNLVNYWPYGAAFVLHPQHFTALLQSVAATGGYSMNPASVLGMVAGWGIGVDPQAQAIGNDAVTDFFGAWNASLIQAQQGRLNLDRYTQTIPGAITYFARFRYLPVVYDTEAYGYIRLIA